MSKPISLLSLLLLAACLTVSGHSGAYQASAESDMSIFNLRFSSSNPGTDVLTWHDSFDPTEWFGTVFAHAQDTDSGEANDYSETLSNNDTIQATAPLPPHTSAQADYSVANGELVAIDPSGSVSADSEAQISLTESGQQGTADAVATLDNFFTVTGGILGSTVDVTFQLDYSGNLQGQADDKGYFSTALAAVLLMEDLDGNLLDATNVHKVHSGIGTSFSQPYTGTLSVSATLTYGVGYWLYGEADSEVSAYTVPAPGTLPLLLGAGLWLARQQRNRRLRHG